MSSYESYGYFNIEFTDITSSDYWLWSDGELTLVLSERWCMRYSYLTGSLALGVF